jgi:hypothetical protein
LALKRALLALGTIQGEHTWLALARFKKVSDLKEITFEDLGMPACTMSATTAAPASTHHSNTLQQRKTLLIPLWCQDQDVHELSTWFNLTPETFDAGENRETR